MASGINTGTIVMIGGLGLLGFGLFYMMSKQAQAQGGSSFDQRVDDATAAAARAAGVSNQAQIDEMRALVAATLQKTQGMSSWEKQMEEKKLTAAYFQMGLTGAVAAVGTIGAFIKDDKPSAAMPLGMYFNPTTGQWQPR